MKTVLLNTCLPKSSYIFGLTIRVFSESVCVKKQMTSGVDKDFRCWLLWQERIKPFIWGASGAWIKRELRFLKCVHSL